MNIIRQFCLHMNNRTNFPFKRHQGRVKPCCWWFLGRAIAPERRSEKNYRAFSKEMAKLIRAQSYPLRVKLVKDDTQLPGAAIRRSTYGIKISLWQWTTMARRWGRILGVGADNINCTPCLAALNLKRMKKRKSLSEYFLKMGSFDSIELEDMGAKELGPIPSGEISAAISPLETAPVDPTFFKSMEHLPNG